MSCSKLSYHGMWIPALCWIHSAYEDKIVTYFSIFSNHINLIRVAVGLKYMQDISEVWHEYNIGSKVFVGESRPVLSDTAYHKKEERAADSQTHIQISHNNTNTQ